MPADREVVIAEAAVEVEYVFGVGADPILFKFLPPISLVAKRFGLCNTGI
jgi:hypothetical protein